MAHAIRDGQTWSFEGGSVFADGWAEFNRADGRGWRGWYGWYGWSNVGDPRAHDGDLQLHFDTVERAPSPPASASSPSSSIGAPR